MKNLILFVVLAFLAPAAHARMQLIVREAGMKGRLGPVLASGTTFCPKQFSDRGFAIECIAPSSARYAIFSVNGRFERFEMKTPYMIAGDIAHVINPWNAKPGKNVITCTASSGERVTAEVDFECAQKMPDGKKKKMRTPSTKPKTLSKNPDMPPSPIAKPVRAPRSSSSSGAQCTTIPATNYVGVLAQGWERVKGGIFYKKDDPFEGVVPASTARVTYKFTPKTTSKYAFVLDMSTSHVTEHNDCFVSITGGWTLHRYGKSIKTSGPTKAYHNRQGRARETYSVDNEAHSFATMSLTKGVTVEIVVGARSTKMGIHNLLLFPCGGDSCDFTSGAWKRQLASCK